MLDLEGSLEFGTWTRKATICLLVENVIVKCTRPNSGRDSVSMYERSLPDDEQSFKYFDMAHDHYYSTAPTPNNSVKSIAATTALL